MSIVRIDKIDSDNTYFIFSSKGKIIFTSNVSFVKDRHEHSYLGKIDRGLLEETLILGKLLK